MTATQSHAGLRPRRVLAGLAGGALLALAVGSSAQAATTSVVPRGMGLTAPAGMVQTPDGAVSVSDELLGVCKVDPSAGHALVASDYCADPHLGPTKPSSLAFDPVSNFLYA